MLQLEGGPFAGLMPPGAAGGGGSHLFGGGGHGHPHMGPHSLGAAEGEGALLVRGHFLLAVWAVETSAVSCRQACNGWVWAMPISERSRQWAVKTTMPWAVGRRGIGLGLPTSEPAHQQACLAASS